MAYVVVDAGIAIKLVVREPDSELADQLFERWDATRAKLIAPSFCFAEMDSVLRKKIERGELTLDLGKEAFAALCALPIKPVELSRQRERAWEIATQFNLPHVYDAVYLALAELRRCEMWTADARLVERVQSELSFVHLLGK